jgi:hypothetical protein
MHWHLDCGGQRCQLLCRCRSTWIRSDEHRAATIFRQAVGKLCCGRRLSRALQAEEEDGRWSFAQIQISARATERFRERAVQDSEHALPRTEATNDLARTRSIADALQQLRYDGHRHICADQRCADIGETSLKVGSTDSAASREAAK